MLGSNSELQYSNSGPYAPDFAPNDTSKAKQILKRKLIFWRD